MTFFRPIALFVLLLLVPSVASAWVQSKSSKGAAIHWESPCVPVFWNELGSDNVTDGTDQIAFELSLDAWSQVPCSFAQLQFAGRTNATVTNYEQEDPRFSMVIFREKVWPYTQRPVAFTSVTYNPKTGVIVDSDIELNGVDYLFTTQPSLTSPALDLQSTLTHELGHVLGFDHVSNPESTMFPKAIAGDTTMRTLSADDEAGVCSVYPQDSFPTCSPVNPDFFDAGDGTPPAPADSGCSASGRSQVGSVAWLVTLLVSLMLALSTMRRKLFGRLAKGAAGLAILASGIFVYPNDAQAYTQFKSSKGKAVQWPPGTCEVAFLLDSYDIPELPADFEVQSLKAAFQAWNDVPCGPVVFAVTGMTMAPVILDSDAVNQIAFVHDSWTKSATYAALTTITYNPYTGVLLDADMEFNLVGFMFSDCVDAVAPTDGRLGPVPFAHTAVHESGHLFGLDHSLEKTAVLYSSGNPYCEFNLPVDLTQDDKDGKCAIYGTDEYETTPCFSEEPIEPLPDSDPDVVDVQSDSSNPNPDVQNIDSDSKPKECCCSAAASPHSPLSPLGLLFALGLVFILLRLVVRPVNRGTPGVSS